MNPLPLLWERIRRRWWLVLLAAVLAVGGSVGAVLLDDDAYTARATLTNASPDQDRDPEDEWVLTQGYVDFFNRAATQDVLREAAGVGPEIEVSARAGANTPLLYVQAVGPDAAATEAAAGSMATALADNVNAGLGPNPDPDQPALLRGVQLDPGVVATDDRIGQTAFAALVGGVLLGALVAIALGRYERRLRSPREVDDRLGLDVVAVVEQGADRAELLRSLMVLADTRAMPRPGTLAVTGPTDGRASQARIALALAGLRAQQGHRTLLVLAEPTNDLLSGILAHAPGVTDVLARDPEGTAGLFAGHVLGNGRELLVCPPGTRTDDTVALYSTPNVERLLARSTGLSDLVVVHAPPADTPEGHSVCAAADRCLVVVEQDRTPARDALAALDGLGRAGATALGAVLVRDPDHLPDPGGLAGGRWAPLPAATGTTTTTAGHAGTGPDELVGASSRVVPSTRGPAEES